MAASGSVWFRSAVPARISPELIRRRTEVQGSGIWTPPTGTLGRIVQETESRVEVLRRTDLSRTPVGSRPSFRDALAGSGIAVIAEAKRKSPSKGWLNAEMSISGRAREYA